MVYFDFIRYMPLRRMQKYHIGKERIIRHRCLYIILV